MFARTFTALLALSASAFAYTTPTTFNITSNPIITPATDSIVPAGKPFTITWKVTESGTVSIILLRGPAKNILPLEPIVEMIPNTGSYTWTPKTTLEPDTTHYGLQLIIDSNGQYQYSGQFGISNPNFVSSSSVAATSTSAATSSEATTTSYETVTHTTKSQVTSFITVTTSSVPVSSYVAPTSSYVASVNSTSVYVPSSTAAPTVSSPLPPVPTQTGAAASLKVASGLFFGVAGVAAMLL
ncbi:hypothetical protein H072_8109 [Dactylellina haptotyla CBS 200.50]|uniref:Yeast cell wall synthesis Kre9/Knh1-like N-terminal domain-containing protein n=1 Tax=Dactylellina haptotyla (strain CBS 200.50) TaxID=1284197 RepID=S8BFZ5_DACHA|nr:hypothetical protein H072_8109 [Dactylellina haptotyla CBS 200.50]